MAAKRARTEAAVSEVEGFGIDFLQFLKEAPTHFHAASAARRRFLEAGFLELSELERWALVPGGKYFFRRNGSSIIAFTVGAAYRPENGFTVLAAHTDSPCLKIKPATCIAKSGCLMLNTQPYGGGLWHTWFDRDLGVAGRILVRGEDGVKPMDVLLSRPIARIPNLAIHLTSGKERESFEPNLHEHAKALLTCDPAVLQQTPESKGSLTHRFLLQLVAEAAGVPAGDIVDTELQLVDCQPPDFGGVRNEFVLSGRLDNLCSCYQSIRALIASTEDLGRQSTVCMAALFDHEEVGSGSHAGAGSSMFVDTLTLICESLCGDSRGALLRSLRRSFIVSTDMAHALHPNYPAKHDPSTAPVLGAGLVIKHNANQRYATNSVSAAMLREAARLAGVGVQEFSVRSDMGCGSTIGPILATLSGALTVDCGSPQLSMHSARECMAVADVHSGYLVLKSVLVNQAALTSSFLLGKEGSRP